MPDSRRHRGPHPEDPRLFAPAVLPTLRQAAADHSWLLGRGYSEKAALKLVGDRFQLDARQRTAVYRASMPDELAATRRASIEGPAGRRVLVDGFNVLVTVEAALAGGVLLRCRDGRTRDMASMHGNYRRMDETAAALDRLVAATSEAAEVVWFLDRPVSNSGRVAAMLRDLGQTAELLDGVDAALVREGWWPATADGPVLDRAGGGVDLLPAALVGVQPWVVDLG